MTAAKVRPGRSELPYAKCWAPRCPACESTDIVATAGSRDQGDGEPSLTYMRCRSCRVSFKLLTH